MECVSSSIFNREKEQQSTFTASDNVLLTTTDETRSVFDRFLEGSARKYRICGSHRSLLAEGSRRTSRFLVRVSLIIAFRSLTIRYEVFAQSGREESSSVNAVH